MKNKETFIEISVNPLAEFMEATDNRRSRIIEEQIDPDPVRIPYYQLARVRMTKSILNNVDHSITHGAIEELRSRNTTEGHWKHNDKINSTKALKSFEDLILPEILLTSELEQVRTRAKHYSIYGVKIKVSPNLIFRTTINGVKTLGAIKLHISKGKKFKRKQSALVAQLLNQFLNNHVAAEDEVVDPRLCICIDPFAGTVVSVSNKISVDMEMLQKVCSDVIPHLWDKAHVKRFGAA